MGDRRTFLGNATAAAVVAKISSFSSFGFAMQAPEAIDPTLSDREKAGLRGPVKNVEDKIVGKYPTETEYSPDGRFLALRTPTSDGSQLIKTWIYDTDDRLAKITCGKMGEPADNESLYTYDETGRLLAISNHPRKGGRMDIQYDLQGRKTTIQTFDFEALRRAKNVIMTGCRVGGAVNFSFGVPVRGKIIGIYNDPQQQTESQIRDAEDRVVGRVVCSYDANGRMIEGKRIQENPAMIRAKEQAEPTAEALEATNQQMKSMPSDWRSYSYDTEGRVIEMRERKRTSSLDRITRTSYNEHGDKSATVEIIEVGEASPDRDQFLSREREIRFTYEYDNQGNWTQRTMNLLVNPSSGPSEATVIYQCKLTYY
jgi:hypothetical protein